MPNTNELSAQIRRFLALRNKPILRRVLSRVNAADLAEVFERDFDDDELVISINAMRQAQAAEVLVHLDTDRQKACLTALSPSVSSKIIRFMPVDEAVDALQELEEDQTRKILAEMPFDSDTRTIHHLLLADPDTAAGIMSTDFVKVSIESTVEDALRAIRAADTKDFIYYCYLVDTTDKLVGVVSLKQLLLQEGSLPLSRLATFDVKTILENYDLDLVANLFRKYDNLLAVPVISPDDTMRGIITLDDALYVIDEQASEDIFLSSGINPEVADERNLLTGPMINAVKARMPWLTITLLGQFVASTIIASHSKTVAAATIAISFMPMLTGLSGNIGAQSETITVRGLALSLISRESLFRQYLREVRVGLTIGSVFGVSVGIISFIIYKHWALSALLACWMIISMSLSVSMGILLPSIYKFFVKQDPAGVTGPFITTLSDILTFSIYLYVISLFIEYMI